MPGPIAHTKTDFKDLDVWNIVAAEKVGFLLYSRNSNRDADYNQEIDDAQDTKLNNINLGDSLKARLLWKKISIFTKYRLNIFFLMFGRDSRGWKNMSVTWLLSSSVSWCFAANESGLKTVFEIPAHTFTNTPQQQNTYWKNYPCRQLSYLWQKPAEDYSQKSWREE